MALDPISAVLNIGESLIDKLIPDRTAAAAAKASLLTMQTQGELAQIAGQLEVDKVEAASNSTFVAGWRPACGWICGFALGYQFLFAPIGTWVAALLGHPVIAPSLDLGSLMTVLLGMLGLTAARSFDKVNGTSNGH